MPGVDYGEKSFGNSPEYQRERTPPSRRSLLRTAAGAGAAGLAAAAGLASWPARARPAATGAGAGQAGEPGAATATAAQPVVVHVRDVRTGEMDIFAGTSQTRVHDHALAARLARAAR
jgi:nitrous oxide reductase